MKHTDDKLDTCPMCGEEMLYWQMQNHILIYHNNIAKWDFIAGDTHCEVCSACAGNIIEANDLVQIDWNYFEGSSNGTDLEFSLWQTFKQKLEPFRCLPCWERNH